MESLRLPLFLVSRASCALGSESFRFVRRVVPHLFARPLLPSRLLTFSRFLPFVKHTRRARDPTRYLRFLVPRCVHVPVSSLVSSFRSVLCTQFGRVEADSALSLSHLSRSNLRRVHASRSARGNGGSLGNSWLEMAVSRLIVFDHPSALPRSQY